MFRPLLNQMRIDCFAHYHFSQPQAAVDRGLAQVFTFQPDTVLLSIGGVVDNQLTQLLKPGVVLGSDGF